MQLVSLNQDKGIGPKRKKGATVHLEAMREAFRQGGHRVLAIDAPNSPEVERKLESALADSDFLYERYALGCDLGSRLCSLSNTPHVVELNAPLADEEREYRGGSVDKELADREEQVFTRAALVVAVSQQVATYALERGASERCILVRPNGVDSDRFVPRGAQDVLRAELVPPGRFALGFHGRLRPWHGLELLGQAAAALLRDGYPIHLVAVGVGEFQEVLGQGLPADHVTCVPWVPHEEVPRFVATFDALPLTYSPDGPSYFSPLKLAEAMACGVVPVFPPLGDLPQLLRDERDALAYSAGDAVDLARVLARLMDDRDLHLRLSKAALLAARGRSWRAIADDVADAVARGRTLGSSASALAEQEEVNRCSPP